MEQLAQGFGLVEGPVWDDQRGLVFSDVLAGGVYVLGADGRVSTLFPHRKGVGGMVQHAEGGMVVSGREISFKPYPDDAGRGGTVQILDRDPEHGNVGYNDITADARGRIYAGSLGNSPVFQDGRAAADGGLFLIDVDGSARQVASGIGLTNGLGFSPDGRVLYHSDSRVRTVWRYDVAADGSLSPKVPFVRTADGVPDGLAVAVDGSVWVALAGGGHGVATFAPDGSPRGFLRIPVPMCTSLCFGGRDLRDLYIVSGSEGTGSERGGAVYRTRVDVAGLPVAVARVRLAR
jgi:gluconolactonase